jgi:hypothetical protein
MIEKNRQPKGRFSVNGEKMRKPVATKRAEKYTQINSIALKIPVKEHQYSG